MGYKAVHQAAGQWDLTLKPETPERVLSVVKNLASYGFAHLFIHPAAIPDGILSTTTVDDSARWAGLLREVSFGGPAVKAGGPGLAVLLGDEDGKGDNPTAEFRQNKDFWNGASASWLLDHVLNGANGITAGTILTNTTDRKIRFEAGASRRKILDTVCDACGYEWRINPNGTLDANAPATLCQSGKAICGPFTGGRESSTLYGINADIDVTHDLDDWTSTVRVNDSRGITGSATIGVNPYVGYAGSALVMRRFIQSQVNTSTDAGNLATQQLGRFDQVDKAIKITTDEYDVGANVGLGDNLYVWDLDAQVYDTANVVYYRGEVVCPQLHRVLSLDVPFEEGMGAVLRYWTGAAFALLDLTPYVQPEAPGAQIEVGTPTRTAA